VAGNVCCGLGEAALALVSAESSKQLAYRDRTNRIDLRERGQAIFLLRLAKRQFAVLCGETRLFVLLWGDVEAGFYKREFGTENEASEFVRDLKGKPVAVHYNPDKPSSSTVLGASIDTLLQTRAPRPVWELNASSRSDAVPEWLQPFVWIFIGLSAVGFVLSLWVLLAL
jgi:hypothetical protein